MTPDTATSTLSTPTSAGQGAQPTTLTAVLTLTSRAAMHLLVLVAIVVAMAPTVEAFVIPSSGRARARRASTPQHTSAMKSNRRTISPAARSRHPTGAATSRIPSPRVRMMASTDSEGGGIGAETPTTDSSSSQEKEVGGKDEEEVWNPSQPVGLAGAMEDDMLIQLVGQDYRLMSLLRNDKFKGLIVLLRNVPPNEWVKEVAKVYPDDDEVKGMLGQMGKLMHMMDYYEAKKPKK